MIVFVFFNRKPVSDALKGKIFIDLCSWVKFEECRSVRLAGFCFQFLPSFADGSALSTEFHSGSALVFLVYDSWTFTIY